MVKTLLDMSELQTVERNDRIMVDELVEEVLEDLEPLAMEKKITLTGRCEQGLWLYRPIRKGRGKNEGK